jgi:hypothetical protein
MKTGNNPHGNKKYTSTAVNSKWFFQKSYPNKIVVPAGCTNKIQNEYGVSFSVIWNPWLIYAVLY